MQNDMRLPKEARRK